MRFVVTDDWRTNRVLRLILALFLVFVLLFWATTLLRFLHQTSFRYSAVVAQYLGQPDAWGGQPVPRSYKVMLEISHAHLFSMGILLLTLAHLLLFVPAAGRLKALIVAVAFGSALSEEASGWLIRYVHPHFAYVKLAAFSLLQLTLAAIVLLVLLALIRSWRNAYADTARPPASVTRAVPHP